MSTPSSPEPSSPEPSSPEPSSPEPSSSQPLSPLPTSALPMAEPMAQPISARSIAADESLSAQRERERAYIASLVRLARDRRQRLALAALRRGLDRRPGETVEMFPYVVPWLEADFTLERQEAYFLVSSLFALYHLQQPYTSQSSASSTSSAAGAAGAAGGQGEQRWVVGPEPRGAFTDEQGVSNFGMSLRRLLIPGVLPAGGDRVERYIVALLETPHEGLSRQLRLLVSLMRVYQVPVDWAQLLADLADWSRDDRRIQRAWAQAYWRYSTSAIPEGDRGGREP